MESIRRHKFLAVLPLLVLLAGALFYGFQRTPRYTAESFQTIGRIDLNQAGALSGFQQATETLATSYARGIRSNIVIEDVSETTGLSKDEVRSRLGAYTVPESSVFVVAAIGSSEDDAIDLSIAGTRALRRWIEQLNSDNPNSDRLLRQFRLASSRFSRLRDEFVRLQQTTDSPAERRRLRRLETRLAAAELRRDVLRVNYGDTRESQTVVSIVQDLALADTARNDRFERLQLALFIAVAAGILLGLALATLRANRDVRRALSVE